ncbi:hypothetical protein BOX15_Mlig018299g2 [Macrostomum lignano]|uniref:C2 domain-containing protein n=1 Tax=Macrostomum lignano TaxID=282301 RepID=A0A267DJL0_9PLAT|nr:hypothetical protein BOX15_Mlig018299g2 [Macrostomum lignano]
MAFYQRVAQTPATSLRGLLSCCYGSRQGRPASPDGRPGSPPQEEDKAGDTETRDSNHRQSSLPTDENCSAGANEDGNCAESMPAAVSGSRTVDGGAPRDPDGISSSQPAWAPPPGPRPVGALDVGIRYECADRQVVVRVIRTLDLRPVGAVDLSGRWNSVLVSLALLPARKQRHQTEMVKGESPAFGESFVFSGIYASELSRLAVRFRAYGCERKRRKLLIGECTLALASLADSPAAAGAPAEAAGTEETLQLPLLPCSGPRSHVGSDTGFSEASSTQAGSCISVMGSAELFLGLGYNAKTGQLAVEVMKGSGFRLPGSSKAPETSVKLALMASTSQILFKSKTSFANATPNPTWKESFMFPINRFQLADVTAVLSIYAKRSIKRREMIGWFAIGRNSSGEEEAAHWHDMLEARGELVSRWHRLLHPDEKK